MIDPFTKVRKTTKKTPELVEVKLTEREARAFLAQITSCRDKALVRVASKITRKLLRVTHLRSVGLLEVLKNEQR